MNELKDNYTLEERLLGLEHAKDALTEHFLSPTLIPRAWNCSYLKASLVNRVARFLGNQKVKLKEREGNPHSQIYRISWPALKRVEYGLLNVQGMHAEVFKRLTDFEAVYFLAGVWRKKSAKDKSKRFSEQSLEENPIRMSVARIIAEGIYLLSYINKTEEKKVLLPYEHKIIGRCRDVIRKSEEQIQRPEEIDLQTYLRNCDKLKTRPGSHLLYELDLERTHPINF